MVERPIPCLVDGGADGAALPQSEPAIPVMNILLVLLHDIYVIDVNERRVVPGGSLANNNNKRLTTGCGGGDRIAGKRVLKYVHGKRAQTVMNAHQHLRPSRSHHQS